MIISRSRAALALALILLATAAVYWPGLYGTFFFDDHPNIVDNKGVQPASFSITSLTAAALSSPSSEFKRPLASLSFAMNYLATGLSPFWFKLTNLLIHLANGVLVYLLTTRVWRLGWPAARKESTRLAGLLITAAWLLLPINLTAVLYIVQRMESLANLFVLLGLLGYLYARSEMLQGRKRLGLACASLLGGTAIGLLAKETAVMLPLYAAMLEYLVIRRGRRDKRIDLLFLLILVVPLVAGSLWLWPRIFGADNWEHRDFTLSTRLLSESRVVVDYILWTVFPTPRALSFYHDDFVISQGLFAPATTALSILALLFLVASGVMLRKRNPTYALGVALFVGSNLLTGTVLPLELVYEHRNYFASIGLVMALASIAGIGTAPANDTEARGRLGAILFVVFIAYFGVQTCLTAMSWGDPLKMAAEIAWRAPKSPRAQYELGRTYIIYSRYDAKSPFVALAYPPLERAAALPGASILPLQAMIYLNGRLHIPAKDAWWDDMVRLLRSRRPGIEDESSLISLTQCLRSGLCDFSPERLLDAYQAALSHPEPSGRLLGAYGDFAWNTLRDRELAERVTQDAIAASPSEPAYRITLARMLIDEGDYELAARTIRDLEALNFGGSLQGSIDELEKRLAAKKQSTPPQEPQPARH
ncbi:MAG: hypothetical protein ACTHOL_19395 [Luteibacter jiangsuensis]